MDKSNKEESHSHEKYARFTDGIDEIRPDLEKEELAHECYHRKGTPSNRCPATHFCHNGAQIWTDRD